MFFAPLVLLALTCSARQPEHGDTARDESGEAAALIADEVIPDISHSRNWLLSPPTIFPGNATVKRVANEGIALLSERAHVPQAHNDSFFEATNSSLARVILADRGANVTAAMDQALHHALRKGSLQENRTEATALLRGLELGFPTSGRANQSANNSTDTSSLLRGLLVPLPPASSVRVNATENSTSPVTRYYNSFLTWLRASHHQGVIVAAVVVAGGFCAWDGPGVWRVLFTVMGAVMVSGIAHFEMSGMNLVPNQSAEAVILLQVAGSTALAIHCGFEGSQVMLGAILGCIGAYSCGDWVRSLDEMMPHGPGLAVFWYLVGSICGILLCTLWRKSVLVMLGPLIGGLCLASSMGVIISRTYAALPDDGDCRIAGCLLPLPPADTPWIDVAKALLGPLQRSGMAVHCVCAVVAMFIHRYGNGRRVWVAISCLDAYILLSALAAFDCPRQKTRRECLSAAAVQFWEWRVAGCLLWALITSCSAWRQLRVLKSAEEPIRNYGGLAMQSPSHQSHDVLPTPPGFLPLHQRDGDAQIFVTQDGPPSLSQWLTTRRSFAESSHKMSA